MRRPLVIASVLLVLAAVFLWIRVAPDRGPLDGGPPTGSADPGARPAAASLDVILERCSRTGDSATAEGWVRNGIAETVRYVELRVHWLDAAGDEVSEEFPEVVGGETLMSGDSVAFRLANPDPRAVGCTAELLSYDPFF